MTLRLELCDARSVAPYAAQLLSLERAITYPLAGGRERFFIDHGEGYHRFFSAMGEPYFLVALDRGSVVGVLVGVLKRCEEQGRSFEAAYVCDFKIAPSHRGSGLAARMLREALSLAAGRPALRRWRFAYGAAMRGDRGDVMRSARAALHPARLASPYATLRLWFVEPHALATLDPRGCPAAPPQGLDLSPALRGDELDLVSTAGRKDLRLVSSGERWPLWHATRSPARARSWGLYLKACGEHLCAVHERALVCFALDATLRPWVAWLAGRGLVSDTICTVYGLTLPGGPRRAAWTHLATSEI